MLRPQRRSTAGTAMFQNWSEPARLALFQARLVAAKSGSATIGLEHVVLGVLQAGRTSAARFASEREAIGAVEQDLQGSAVSMEGESPNRELPFDPEVTSLLRTLAATALTRTVELEAILKAVLTTTSGPAAQSLARSRLAEIL